jgi:hypothetical protein
MPESILLEVSKALRVLLVLKVSKVLKALLA